MSRVLRRSLPLVVSLTAALAPSAHAEDALRVGGLVTNFGAGARLEYAHRFSHDAALGLRLTLSSERDAFIDGFVLEDALGVEVSAVGALRLARRGATSLHAHVPFGIWSLSGATGGPDGSGLQVGGEPALFAQVALSETLRVRAGLTMPVYVQVRPSVEIASLDALLGAGLDYTFLPGWSAYAQLDGGGAFGFGGDGPKVKARGQVGLRYAFSELAAEPDDERPEPGPATVAPFVGLGWRALRLADHWSHGPDFQAGVLLWGFLKLGVAGFGRPGPINPRTFTTAPANGLTYKGQTSIDLRSDGAVIGLLIGGRFSVLSWLDVEVPVILGSGAFGFYLTGEDRETPDGRRVSAWENELLDGRDAAGGFGLDAGLRLGFRPSTLGPVRPYVGVHYTTVLGYDAFIRGDYGGFSATAGLEIGAW